mmetsp:Transcript_34909/g.81669  ORF Transcript_34909/g.81669 Transcript_34909/m.81669 type:complete len:228 (+) Transcript_34909:2419-3102(+)
MVRRQVVGKQRSPLSCCCSKVGLVRHVGPNVLRALVEVAVPPALHCKFALFLKCAWVCSSKLPGVPVQGVNSALLLPRFLQWSQTCSSSSCHDRGRARLHLKIEIPSAEEELWQCGYNRETDDSTEGYNTCHRQRAIAQDRRLVANGIPDAAEQERVELQAEAGPLQLCWSSLCFWIVHCCWRLQAFKIFGALLLGLLFVCHFQEDLLEVRHTGAIRLDTKRFFLII